MAYNFEDFPSRGGCCSRRRSAGRVGAVIPPTTDSTLVFHYDRTKNRFDRNFYAPALTNGRLSWEQVDTFLCEVEFILKKKARSLKAGIMLMIGMLFLGIFGLFSMMLALDDEYTDDDDLDDFGFAMVAYFMAVIVLSIALQVQRKKVFKKARKSVQAVVDRSRQVMEPLGLRWNLPMYFPFWIELCKDYHLQTAYTYPGNQTYFSYMVPQQLNMIPQRPVIQNPIYNQHYQDYQKRFVYQPVVMQQQRHQEFQQENSNYQPPVMNRNDSNNEYNN